MVYIVTHSMSQKAKFHVEVSPNHDVSSLSTANPQPANQWLILGYALQIGQQNIPSILPKLMYLAFLQICNYAMFANSAFCMNIR